MTEETTGEWIECIVDNDYEIFSEYPYSIRRKGSDKVISEHLTNDGYIRCCLNNKKYMRHRIIAQQFIPNPNNLTQVDHINHNRIENLRWVSKEENMKNMSSSSKHLTNVAVGSVSNVSGRTVLYAKVNDGPEIAIVPFILGSFESTAVNLKFDSEDVIIFKTTGAKVPIDLIGTIYGGFSLKFE